ncbi:MAG: Holliday junction resolvase RuvX [Planctomycetes bacterium]|nr:Holliday junction resolvase RuvX [Planctomycetota bacterium]
MDYGEKRTGLASADALWIAAVPIGTIETSDREELLEAIVDAVDDRNATTVVVGLPLHIAGHDSARSRSVRELCAALRKRLPYVDVVEFDERGTTKEANALMAASGVHWKKRKGKLDAVAAVLILRSYMQKESERGEQFR